MLNRLKVNADRTGWAQLRGFDFDEIELQRSVFAISAQYELFIRQQRIDDYTWIDPGTAIRNNFYISVSDCKWCCPCRYEGKSGRRQFRFGVGRDDRDLVGFSFRTVIGVDRAES